MNRRAGMRSGNHGQGVIEYALILSLVAMIALGLLQNLGRLTSGGFCKVSNGLAGGGPLYGTGRNDHGQLAIGTMTGNYTTPQEAINICGAVIAAGNNQLGAVGNDNTLWEWGITDGYGEFGPNAPVGVSQATPVKIPLPAADGNAIALGIGSDTDIALTADGSVYTWGADKDGQLGNGVAPDTAAHATPQKVSGLPAITAVAAAYATDYALTSGGVLYAWGMNSAGMLGNGTFTSAGAAPVGCTCAIAPQLVPLSGVKSINAAVGSTAVYALMGNGTVESWGTDSYGGVGNNQTATYIATPTLVLGTGCSGVGLQNIASVAPLQWGAIALDNSGNVYAWGRNSPYSKGGGGYWAYGGEMGDGTTIDRPCPVQPQGTGGAGTYLTGATIVGASAYGSYAEVGGTLYTWGSNMWGELGYTSGGNYQGTPLAAPSYAKGILKVVGSYGVTLAMYPPTSS
jgi:alpha-tubulin suppressor-like RCC1 family protein